MAAMAAHSPLPLPHFLPPSPPSLSNYEQRLNEGSKRKNNLRNLDYSCYASKFPLFRCTNNKAASRRAAVRAALPSEGSPEDSESLNPSSSSNPNFVINPNFIGSARRDAAGSGGVKLNFVSEPRKEKGGGGGRIHGSSSNIQRPRVDAPAPDGSVIVQATRRGRGGKTVTVVSGLQLNESSMQALTKKLKNLLGTGGAVKDGNIEIQGDQATKLVEELSKLGYKAKKSGK